MANLTLIFVIFSTWPIFCAGINDTTRSLIFPAGIGNKIQFLTGFGIPVSHLPEPYSITYGYVIKTNFAIFDNVSVFHDPYIEYQSRSAKPSRWQIYELLQSVADSDKYDGELEITRMRERDDFRSFVLPPGRCLGYSGRECLLRLICEMASTYLVKNGLVSEILHFLLTPSFTGGKSFVSAQNEEFYKAESCGKMNLKPCSSQYPNCKLNFLDMFSLVRKTDDLPYNKYRM